MDTPRGPCWHRYNHDGYGEHADGAPFDGTGVGRVWPLLTGERAHYELAAGRKAEADKLRRAMETLANDSGLMPEQIWDSPDIPERDLFFGRPSGSAMPLVWAHGEYVKLRRSLHDGRVFDMPHQAAERYLVRKTTSPHVLWRFEQPAAPCRRARCCGWKSWPRRWSTGAATAGGRRTTRRRGTPARRLCGRPAHGEIGRGRRSGLYLPLVRAGSLGREGLSRDGDGGGGAASRLPAPRVVERRKEVGA